jgi:hypothetical protein
VQRIPQLSEELIPQLMHFVDFAIISPAAVKCSRRDAGVVCFCTRIKKVSQPDASKNCGHSVSSFVPIGLRRLACRVDVGAREDGGGVSWMPGNRRMSGLLGSAPKQPSHRHYHVIE